MAIVHQIFSLVYLWFLTNLIIPNNELFRPKYNAPSMAQDTIRLKFNMLDLKCLDFEDGTYIVNSLEELMKANGGKVKQRLATCKDFTMPAIDFKKYTLVGIHTNVIGCKKPTRTLKLYKLKGLQSINIDDIFSLEGYCKRINHFSDWFLIDKVAVTTYVKIRIRTSG